MSAQHHDIEHSHAAHDRAVSASSSPLRRDLVEDTDNFTRKRQRLDDGGAILRTMSNDPDSPSKAITSPHKEMVAMTIREHSPPSPSPAADAEDPIIATGSSIDQVSTPTLPPVMTDGPADDRTSPPVIEIIDDDENVFPTSVPRSLSAEEYFESFPFSTEHRTSLQTLHVITEHIHKSQSIAPDLLPLLARWLRGLPDDTPENLQSFYVRKLTFWVDFAGLVERLLKRRYHWMTALETGQDDDLSRYPFGETFGDDAEVDAAFSSFFSAYMRLCSRLFSVDVNLLNRTRREEHYAYPLLSEKHMYHLHSILRTEKTPLFHLLRKQHGIDVHDLSSRLHMDFLLANGAQNLLRLSEETFHNIPTTLQNHLGMYTCQILSTLGWTVCRLSDGHSDINPGEYYSGTLSFFWKYTEDLQDTTRVTDAAVAREMILCFSSLIQEISQWDDGVSRTLADELLSTGTPKSPTTSSPVDGQVDSDTHDYTQYLEFLPVMNSNTWKFKLLRRYIVKGKMELRLMSIIFMDEALLKLYHEYNDSNSTDKHPVLRHLADVLIQGRVVDYIMSVDSHPQLISRSGNVPGFLLVTDRWSDSQADSIWNIVSLSPDPRMVTATMTMLRSITNHMKPTDHLYFCMKLYDLPVANYTSDMLCFLRELTAKLLDRRAAVDWSLRGENARPWNVCVRLLQHTASRCDATKHDSEINADVDEQLHLMARLIPESDQRSIFAHCLKEIATRSDRATGSVRIITILGALLNASFLRQDVDMARQVVEELPSFIEAENKATPHHYQLLALQNRLDLLKLLICETGDMIPQHLYTMLWDHLVGPQALSNQARDAAWVQLLQSTKDTPDNEFCRQLISRYVPNLDPKYFTPSLYNFVANYTFPLHRKIVQIDGVEHSLLQIPGGDLLWSLALFSPPGTIEESSAHDLAVRYTQIPQSGEIALSDVEFAHVELVERCFKELRSSFQTLREGSDRSRQDSQIRFSRVLMFLKKMLELVRQRPEFNRGRRADSKVESMDIDIPAADAITIRYQVGNDRKSIDLAPDRTVADLHRVLCQLTECSKINLFAAGQKLDTIKRADEKIVDANIDGQLLVQPLQRQETMQAISTPVAGCSEFETELVKHFDEMFAWLDADNMTDQLLFDFLTLFPYRSNLTNIVAADNATFENLFPCGKVFQARYAVQAIHNKLKEQLRSSALDESFLVNAIKLLDRAILSSELLGDDDAIARGLPLAAVFISAMSDFLRERPTSDRSKEYFSDATALANRLVGMLLASVNTADALKATQDCYATIVEAGLCSIEFWNTFWEHPNLSQVHEKLLLTDPREPLRQCIKLKILSVCGGHLPSSCNLDMADIASRYWATIAGILPATVQEAGHSDQIFELAQHAFRAYDEHHRNEDYLRSLLHDWTRWLLNYDHKELPGCYEVDKVVSGFTKLLLCLVPSLKSHKHPLNASDLVSAIFQKFLFPSSSPAETMSQAAHLSTSSLPVLDSSARRELYDLVLALTDDDHSYEQLLQLSGDVEVMEVDNIFTSSVDRSSEIRSQTGYVGLHNPRAICYMNSLLVHLFMNLNFREFILGVDTSKGGGSQQLLLETQKLFAKMQESYRKSADPRPFAECVQTLDKTPIDVSVQMDADEFYNLLFDQWEAQLVTSRDKQRFRNFYGGQMLQQVKSKECEHVSERADSFFALQCDVQGKANLQESLQAFVQGDVMEGDNKYKCESCGGKFVDAVKRTCLKRAPDNLIFHLKRFDFDFNDFSRKKVNEHFAFPDSIDIGLYNVEHLSDPSKPHQEDYFDLVGVVVHFGNCENGHYYSYIRKRPDPSDGDSPVWLNFNDELVDPFDPAEIPQKAFGGLTDNSYTRQYKMYSAYMLFYQRRTAIATDQQRWTVSSQAQPPKVAIPQPIKNDIDLQNEVFIREYCLFDPYHSAFVRHLHGASRRINNGTCSEDHKQEKRALHVFLAHLGRVVWRQQTTKIFEEAVLHLRRSVMACQTCCRITLQWLARDDEVLHNLILRCPHPSIRSQMREFLIDSLQSLRDGNAHLDETATDRDTPSDTDGDAAVIEPIAKRLAILADDSWRHARAWDDLYLLLIQIAEMGHPESAALLDSGILVFCLRLFCMHVRPQLADRYAEFQRIFAKRTGVFNMLVAFMYTLMSRLDMNLEGCNNPRRLDAMDRERMVMPLTSEEMDLLYSWHSENKAYAVIDKMTEVFDAAKSDTFYPGDLLKSMIEPFEARIDRNVVLMIVQGISELNNPFCDPYLRVAASYCEVTPNLDALGKICSAVINAIEAHEKSAPSGGAVLRFFQQLCRTNNPHISTAETQRCLVIKCRKYAHILLLYPEEDVRIETFDFIHGLFTQYMEDPENLEEAYKHIRLIITDMTKRIVYECGPRVPRRHLQALLETSRFLVSLLYDLNQSEDPALTELKEDHDTALLHQWQIEVETRMRSLPEGGIASPSEGMIDVSDYGSESDEVELLDP